MARFGSVLGSVGEDAGLELDSVRLEGTVESKLAPSLEPAAHLQVVSARAFRHCCLEFEFRGLELFAAVYICTINLIWCACPAERAGLGPALCSRDCSPATTRFLCAGLDWAWTVGVRGARTRVGSDNNEMMYIILA